MNRDKIKQWILIAVFGVCTLFSLVISILSMVPVNTTVEIREEIRVFSSAVSASDNTAYVVEVSGAIRNSTERDLVVERLEVQTVTYGGKSGPVVVFENVELPARATVTVARTVTSEIDCNGAGEIYATVAGERSYLRNPAVQEATASLVPLFFTLVFGYLLVYACRVYRYMLEEERAQ